MIFIEISQESIQFHGKCRIQEIFRHSKGTWKCTALFPSTNTQSAASICSPNT